MKKFTALILVFTILFTFVACGEKNNTEIPTDTTTSEIIKITTTEAKTTETSQTKKYLTATEEDFEKLPSDILNILMNVPGLSPVFGECDDEEFKELVRNSTPEDYKNAYYYNSEADDALGYAMFIIWNGRKGTGGLDLEIDCETYYAGIGYNQDGDEINYVSDPKHKFDEAPGYKKFNADQLDIALKEVFCVEPDRTKTSDDFGIEPNGDNFSYYYHDGYYYYYYDEGGGGDYRPEIVDCTKQPDGSYIVKLSNQNSHLRYAQDMMKTPDEEYVYKIYEVSVALKEIDGERIWSFRYLKLAEFVLSTE